MQELSEKIKAIENQIEAALWDSEVHEELEKALQAYQDAESKLECTGYRSRITRLTLTSSGCYPTA